MNDPDEALKVKLLKSMTDVIKIDLQIGTCRSDVINRVGDLNEHFSYIQLTEMLAYALVKIAELEVASERVQSEIPKAQEASGSNVDTSESAGIKA